MKKHTWTRTQSPRAKSPIHLVLVFCVRPGANRGGGWSMSPGPGSSYGDFTKVVWSSSWVISTVVELDQPVETLTEVLWLQCRTVPGPILLPLFWRTQSECVHGEPARRMWRNEAQRRINPGIWNPELCRESVTRILSALSAKRGTRQQNQNHLMFKGPVSLFLFGSKQNIVSMNTTREY